MTEDNEHKQSNDELDAYLRGGHAVSKAYEELEKVSSPKDLDERILAKSRESVASDLAGRDSWSYRPYAAAATVFLCLSVTFMFINEPGVPVPSDLQSSNESLRSIPVTLQQGAQGAQGIQEAQERQERFSPAVQTLELDSLADSAISADAVREQVPESTAAQLQLFSDENTNAVVPELRANAAQDQLEEISLTGARLDETANFREDQESWLQEIARLRSEGEADNAQREAGLFLESYPGTDIEAALAELE